MSIPAAPARPPLPLHERLTWLSLPLAVALFLFYPSLDLDVSRRLYIENHGFAHAWAPLVRFSYEWAPVLGRTLLVGLLAAWLVGRWRPARVPPLWRRTAPLALCIALLGPGLLIEGICKPHVQRPRPVQTQDFGGSQPYQPPLRRCAACTEHHSFVSSHAAAGFYLLSLGLLASPAWRRRWFAVGLLAGGLVGLGRMLQGGHYLSDIVFAFYAVWLSAQAVLWLWRRRAPPPAGAP